MNAKESTNTVVEVRQLTRRYGNKLALNEVSLNLKRGEVFGLVGENGAGKTTLLKHVLGLLRVQSGSVRVFGLDPVANPEGVLGRIGYLAEERDLPGWMRLWELLRYTQAFYPTWDEAYAERLREDFALDRDALIKHLSQGERARAGLLIALAYRPELLVLDEPSGGLDPVVRQEILEAIVRTVAEEGRTVLFSSHLLDEVERVCDRVGMLSQGQMVLCDDLDAIKAAHHQVTLRFAAPQAQAPQLRGALSVRGQGLEWTVVCNGSREALAQEAAQLGARIVDERVPTLNEIFVARVGSQRLRAVHG